VSYDNSVPGRPALKIQIDLASHLAEQMTLDLSLANLVPGLDAIRSLVDVNATGKFAVDANAALNLDLGLDLTNPSAPLPFLYGSTDAHLDLKVSGTDIGFTVGIGPVGASVIDGNIAVDIDGIPDTNPADRAQFA